MYIFVISNKQNSIQNLGKNITNEQEIYQKELKDNKQIQWQDNNDIQFCKTTNLDNELQNYRIQNKMKIIMTCEIIFLQIFMIQVIGKILKQYQEIYQLKEVQLKRQ